MNESRFIEILVVGNAPTIGDAAIGAALVDELRTAFPNPRIRFATRDSDSYLGSLQTIGLTFEPEPRVSISPMWNRLPRIGGHLGFLRAAIPMHLPEWVLRHDPLWQRTFEQFRGLDLVVFQGGPSWNDRWLSLGDIRNRFLLYLVFRRMGIPIVLWGHSFGPFAWRGSRGTIMKHLARATLNRVSVIGVRDAFSAEALRALRVVSPEIVESADIALLLKPSADDRNSMLVQCLGGGKLGRVKLGISVRAFQRHYGIGADDELAIRAEIARFLDRCGAAEIDVVFTSTDFRIRSDRLNDLQVMEDIQSRMRRPQCIKVLREPQSPRELKLLYGQMDFLVSMRLHPIIIAMTEGVPCMSIAYDRKCTDFMQQAGMSSYCCGLRQFSGDAAFHMFNNMRQQGDQLRGHIRLKVEDLRAKAKRTRDAVLRLIAEEVGKRKVDNPSGNA